MSLVTHIRDDREVGAPEPCAVAAAASSGPELPGRPEQRRSLRRVLHSLARSPAGVIGAALSGLVVFAAVAGPLLVPFDPAASSLSNAFLAPSWLSGQEHGHFLGTDNQGRDLFSRVLVGTRVSVIVGLGAVALSGAIGLVLGLLAGFLGGVVDVIIMRIVDALLAIPTMLFMLVIALVAGTGIVSLIVVIGVTSWVSYARIVRAEVLSLRERDFVTASRMAGTGTAAVLFRHLFPNVLPSFVVMAALSLGGVILAESALSFLGLGIQAPEISWGQMLSDGRQYVASSWWIATFPGIAITLTVLGIILLGDWLRDLLDVRIET